MFKINIILKILTNLYFKTYNLLIFYLQYRKLYVKNGFTSKK